MAENEKQLDWVETAPLTPSNPHYVRTTFVGAELRDFGRDRAIMLKAENGKFSFVISRHEAQKLFDEMWWAYYFRPTENP